MTIPAVDSLSTYGGPMQNYAPVEDPTTDRDAAAANQAYASTAAMTHTAVRAIVRFTTANSTNGLVLVSHDAVWGNSIPPTLSRTSTGYYIITFPSTVTDELGNTQSVALRYGWGNAISTNAWLVTAAVGQGNVISPGALNTVAVRVFDPSANTDGPTDVVVYVV